MSCIESMEEPQEKLDWRLLATGQTRREDARLVDSRLGSLLRKRWRSGFSDYPLSAIRYPLLVRQPHRFDALKLTKV